MLSTLHEESILENSHGREELKGYRKEEGERVQELNLEIEIDMRYGQRDL